MSKQHKTRGGDYHSSHQGSHKNHPAKRKVPDNKPHFFKEQKPSASSCQPVKSELDMAVACLVPLLLGQR